MKHLCERNDLSYPINRQRFSADDATLLASFYCYIKVSGHFFKLFNWHSAVSGEIWWKVSIILIFRNFSRTDIIYTGTCNDLRMFLCRSLIKSRKRVGTNIMFAGNAWYWSNGIQKSGPSQRPSQTYTREKTLFV